MLSYYDKTGSEKPTLKESFSFSFHKIKRLYPLHIITMLLAAAYMVFDKYINNSLDKNYLMHIAKCMVLNVPLLQSWVPKMYVAFSLNGPSWFLSDSLFLYAVFPYLVVLLKRRLTKKNAFPMMIIVFAVQTFLFFTIGRLKPSEQYTNEWSKWYSYISLYLGWEILL
jgi:hypothetical protein